MWDVGIKRFRGPEFSHIRRVCLAVAATLYSEECERAAGVIKTAVTKVRAPAGSGDLSIIHLLILC